MNNQFLNKNPNVSTEVKKALQNPRTSTIKRLFAVPQNKCAFPHCSETLVADDGKVTGEICNIKAGSKKEQDMMMNKVPKNVMDLII
ncbi:hypothetical protein GYH73_002265 [Bacillus megaterium]|nr:hypothetical protein [Priestia megaterium]NEW00670.1 hypothetical protein [Priestia megaterium]